MLQKRLDSARGHLVQAIQEGGWPDGRIAELCQTFLNQHLALNTHRVLLEEVDKINTERRR